MKDLEQDIRSKIFSTAPSHRTCSDDKSEIKDICTWILRSPRLTAMHGVVWSEGKAKTDVPRGHAVMQWNIPKLGTAMYRISSGFMNCIHKTWCGQCNGCLLFINGSLKWLPLHWRFLHRALSFTLKQVLYTVERRASVAISSLKSSLQLHFLPRRNTVDTRYTTPDRRFEACTQTLKTLDLPVVNFELHPSSLYPQAWSWHSNQVTAEESAHTQAALSLGMWHVQDPHNPSPLNCSFRTADAFGAWISCTHPIPYVKLELGIFTILSVHCQTQLHVRCQISELCCMRRLMHSTGFFGQHSRRYCAPMAKVLASHPELLQTDGLQLSCIHERNSIFDFCTWRLRWNTRFPKLAAAGITIFSLNAPLTSFDI